MSTTALKTTSAFAVWEAICKLEGKLSRMPYPQDVLDKMGKTRGWRILNSVVKGAYFGVTKWDDVVSEVFRDIYQFGSEEIHMTGTQYDVLEFIAEKEYVRWENLQENISWGSLSLSLNKLLEMGLIEDWNSIDGFLYYLITPEGVSITEPHHKANIVFETEQIFDKEMPRPLLEMIREERYREIHANPLSILDPGFYQVLRRTGNLDLIPGQTL